MANQVTPEEYQKSIDQPDSIKAALDHEGITLSYLAKLLKKELEAKQVKVFQHQGTIIKSEELEALDIRQKARQDAHKLRGDYPAEKHEVEGTVFQVIDYSKGQNDKGSDTKG